MTKDKDELAADTPQYHLPELRDRHRRTPVRSSGPTGQAQTFVRRTSPDKNSHRFAKRARFSNIGE